MAVGHQGPAGLGELMHRLCIVLHGLFQNLVLLQHGDGTLLILQREGTVTTTALPSGLYHIKGRQADCMWGGQEEGPSERKKPEV